MSASLRRRARPCRQVLIDRDRFGETVAISLKREQRNGHSLLRSHTIEKGNGPAQMMAPARFCYIRFGTPGRRTLALSRPIVFANNHLR